MKDFIWGVASSAYQIEGGYREDGKGDSIWDTYAHLGKIANGETGDVACDHYHRYKEDVALLKKLGVKAYRFSIAWTRVLPSGIGEVNEKGVQFYENLINELLINGITPWITLFHWDYPQKLEDMGGWLNPQSPKWFGEYARLIGNRFGEKVKYFITLNEPQSYLGGYTENVRAPGMEYQLTDRFLLAHNLLKGHGEAVKALRETVKDAKIGIAPSGWALMPKNNTEQEIERARRAYFTLWKHAPFESVSLFSDPILLGDYPKEYYEYFKDVIPVVTKEDLALISQPIDFYGQNIYSGATVTERDEGDFIWDEADAEIERTALGWPIQPKALYWGPKFLYERYKKPIIITENGIACKDVVNPDKTVHDSERITFIHAYIKELQKAIFDGIKIDAYFYWSFMDNLEWKDGYAARFGLVFVDFTSQKRFPKDSFYEYQAIIGD